MHTNQNRPVNQPPVNTSHGSRMPWVLQVQAPPEVQPYVQRIGARLLDNIQHNANSSIIRQSLYYHMSPNGFYNPEFIDLAQFAVEYVDALMYLDRLDIEAAINLAIEEVGTIAAASETQLQGGDQMYRSLPGEMQQLVINWIQHLQTVVKSKIARTQDSRRFQQPAPVGQYGAPMASYNPQGGYPQGGYPQAQPQQPYYQPGPINRNQPITNSISRMAAAPTSQSFNNSTMVEVRGGGIRSSVSDSAVPAPMPKVSTPTPTMPADGYHQQLKADYPDGKPVLEGVYCGVFNIHSSVAFFAFRDGVAKNFIVDKDQCSMKYTDHRNEQLLRGRTIAVRHLTPDYPAADAVFEAMVKQQSVNDMLAEIEKRQADATVTGDVDVVADLLIPCLVNLNNSTDYHNVANLAMDELELSVSVEDSTITFTGIDFGAKPYSEGAMQLQTEMRSARTHEELRALLVRVRDTTPLYHWEQLDVAVTEYVNELLQTMMGIELRMDCYTEEINDLIDTLMVDYPEALDRFNTTLLRRVQLVVLDNDSTHLWRGVFDCTDGDGKTCHTLTTLQDITLLPVTSTDINIGCMDNVGVVSPKATPNLYRAARHRIDNAHPKTRWIKFITLDRMVIYVYATSDGGVLVANQPFV